MRHLFTQTPLPAALPPAVRLTRIATCRRSRPPAAQLGREVELALSQSPRGGPRPAAAGARDQPPVHASDRLPRGAMVRLGHAQPVAQPPQQSGPAGVRPILGEAPDKPHGPSSDMNGFDTDEETAVLTRRREGGVMLRRPHRRGRARPH